MSEQRMNAGVLEATEHFAMREWPMPELDKDDAVLMRVHACGVCMSEVSWWKLKDDAREYPWTENVLDWELSRTEPTQPRPRQYPILMGHEPSGEILAVGKHVTHLKPGMHAVALGGRSFAEYGLYSAESVHPIQSTTTYIEALGEPLACAFNATQRTNVQAGERVVLVGCGFMGLMQLQMMKLADPAVIVAIDIRDDALAVASKVGADVVINSTRENVVEAVRDAVGPKGANVVVEAVGKQVGLDVATRLVGWNGRIAVLGYHQGEPRSIDMGMWNVKGIDVINAHERYRERYFSGMVGGIQLVEEGKIDMGALVTHVYPLDKIDDAFHDSVTKPEGFIKAVITPFVD